MPKNVRAGTTGSCPLPCLASGIGTQFGVNRQNRAFVVFSGRMEFWIDGGRWASSLQTQNLHLQNLWRRAHPRTGSALTWVPAHLLARRCGGVCAALYLPRSIPLPCAARAGPLFAKRTRWTQMHESSEAQELAQAFKGV